MMDDKKGVRRQKSRQEEYEMARRGENIYKRGDGRWEGRYIRGRTPEGRAQYGYVHVSLRHKQQAVQSICFLPICGGDFAPSEIPSGAAKAAVRQGAAAQVS